MDNELIIPLIPLFETFLWVFAIITIFLILRNELKDILKRFSDSDEVEMSLGALTIQAKTIRELQRSIGLGFPEGQVDRKEIEAIVDIKLKSIQSAIEHTIAQTDIREDARIPLNEEIIIKCEDGSELRGFTLNVSEAGIGFKSDGRLRFNEIIKITPSKSTDTDSKTLNSPVRIIRIEESKEGYYYGATLM